MILSSLTQDSFGLFLFYTSKVQYHNPIFNATLFNPVFNKIPIKTCEMVESWYPVLEDWELPIPETSPHFPLNPKLFSQFTLSDADTNIDSDRENDNINVPGK